MTLQTKLTDVVYRLATGSRKIRNVYTPIDAAFFGLIVCAFIFSGLKVDRLMGIGNVLPLSISIPLSLPIFAMALFMIDWSLQHFLKAKGTPVPANPPPRLITTGPYAHTRNPMLTGVFALLFGFGILFGSVFLLFFSIPIFIAINYWGLKQIEEPELVKRQEGRYADYRAVTPMFLPNFRRKTRKEV